MVEPVRADELDAIIEVEDEYRRRRKLSSYTPTRDYRMAWELRELRRGNPVDAALETAGEELGHIEAERDELRALLEAHHDADDGPCFVCTAAPTAEQVQYAKSWGYDL